MTAMVLDGGQEAFLALAAFGAGIVNGAAGGGTLLSFPALLAVGFPALTANVTSSVGIWTGYLGGVAGFRREVVGQPDRLRALAATVVAGGVAGAVLLLTTPSGDFRLAAPYLVLFACVLFGLQPLLADRLSRRRQAGHDHRWLLQSGVFLVSVYGAYFGAGAGIVYLAVLAITLTDSLGRLNGLRSVLSLIVSTASVLVFVFSAHVAWLAAGVMAGGALVGGYVGAHVARRIPTAVFRVVVVGLGLATAIELLVH